MYKIYRYICSYNFIMYAVVYFDEVSWYDGLIIRTSAAELYWRNTGQVVHIILSYQPRASFYWMFRFLQRSNTEWTYLCIQKRFFLCLNKGAHWYSISEFWITVCLYLSSYLSSYFLMPKEWSDSFHCLCSCWNSKQNHWK